MIYVKPLPSAPFPSDAVYMHLLAGPETGIESCLIRFISAPQGLRGAPLHLHEEDQIYYALHGKLSIQIGAEVVTALPGELVLIPKGTPHCYSNQQRDDARFLSFRGPYPKGDAGVAAEARPVAGVAGLVRQTWSATIEKSTSLAYKGESYGTLRVVERANGGGGVRVHAVRVEKGSSVVSHIHPFDQFYLVNKGVFKITIGLKDIEVGPGNFVVVPAGVVHRNWNDGPGVEEHLVVIAPEPEKGEPLAVGVTIGAPLG